MTKIVFTYRSYTLINTHINIYYYHLHNSPYTLPLKFNYNIMIFISFKNIELISNLMNRYLYEVKMLLEF